jgi:hypothetical protein
MCKVLQLRAEREVARVEMLLSGRLLDHGATSLEAQTNWNACDEGLT